MKTNPDEPLNCNNGKGFWTDELNVTHAGRGLTKREYFAAMALQGILANASGIQETPYWSSYATKYADELIKQLNKPKTDE